MLLEGTIRAGATDDADRIGILGPLDCGALDEEASAFQPFKGGPAGGLPIQGWTFPIRQ